MSVLGDVFGSLKSMSQVQLLLAFIACIGYAFAQGSLLPGRGRRLAGISAALAAFGFALESADWTYATMLLGFAVAGLGSFIALVWITSRALGFGRASPRIVSDDEAEADAAAVAAGFLPAPAGTAPRVSRTAEHAHSV